MRFLSNSISNRLRCISNAMKKTRRNWSGSIPTFTMLTHFWMNMIVSNRSMGHQSMSALLPLSCCGLIQRSSPTSGLHHYGQSIYFSAINQSMGGASQAHLRLIILRTSQRSILSFSRNYMTHFYYSYPTKSKSFALPNLENQPPHMSYPISVEN